MGYPMAGHLAGKGFAVTVYNRTAAKAARWCGEHRGHQATSPAAAARGAAIVFTCVGNDQDLEQVILGPGGVAEGLVSGAVVVDHSTVSATLSRRLADTLAARGAAFIDAPVSGGQQGALNGQLAIMCGGEEAVYERVRPALASYARAMTRGVPLPVTAQVDGFYADVQAMGGGRWDTSSLLARLDRQDP